MAHDFLDLVRGKATEKLLFLPHAVRQMSHPGRMITTAEVKKILFEGEVIEDYPEDVRGHSCLLLGLGETERAIHVVCSPKDEYLAIITAYHPNEGQWESDFKSRRKQ